MMKTKIARYSVLIGSMVVLVILNVVINARCLEMSEQVLTFESQIKSLRRENMTLESKLSETSSLQFIASVAQSAGYEQNTKFIHLQSPVMAQR